MMGYGLLAAVPLVSVLASTASAQVLAANRSAILDDVVAASQSVCGRRFADEITRFFRTLVG